MDEKKLCDCCGKELEDWFAGSKFCSSCAVYHRELKDKINVLQNRLERWIGRYNTLKNKKSPLRICPHCKKAINVETCKIAKLV
jgi:hypothetical protein